MRPNGEDVRRLTTHHDVSATTPTWSPDSTKVAYSLFLWSEKRYQLCVLDFTSKQWTHLLYTDVEIYPVWTPYNTIAFSVPDEEGTVRLYEVDTVNRRPRRVPRFEAGDAEPVWTWDGKWVVFGRAGGFAVMNTGTGETRFFTTDRTAIQWSVSPDAEHVAYTSQEQGTVAGFEVFLIRLQDEFKKKLVNNPIVDDHEVDSRYVSWSPYL
jgi:Tol biopolymer transport system component